MAFKYKVVPEKDSDPSENMSSLKKVIVEDDPYDEFRKGREQSVRVEFMCTLFKYLLFFNCKLITKSKSGDVLTYFNQGLDRVNVSSMNKRHDSQRMSLGDREEIKDDENDNDVLMGLPRTLQPAEVLKKFAGFIAHGCPQLSVNSDRYLWDANLKNVLKPYYEGAQMLTKIRYRKVSIERKPALPTQDIRVLGATSSPLIQGLDGHPRLIHSERILSVFNHDLDEKEDLKSVYFVSLLCIHALSTLATKFLEEINAAYDRYKMFMKKGKPFTHEDVMFKRNVPFKEFRELRRIIMGFGEIIWQQLTTDTVVGAVAGVCSYWEPEITHWSNANIHSLGPKSKEVLKKLKEMQKYCGPFVANNIPHVEFISICPLHFVVSSASPLCKGILHVECGSPLHKGMLRFASRVPSHKRIARVQSWHTPSPFNIQLIIGLPNKRYGIHPYILLECRNAPSFKVP